MACGAFEFVIADLGVGILPSLRRRPLYAALSDHGKALESALTDGISRFGSDTGQEIRNGQSQALVPGHRPDIREPLGRTVANTLQHVRIT